MATISLPARKVLGFSVACLNYDGAVARIRSWARLKDRAYAVEAANTHVVTLARHDLQFGTMLREFDLLLPDGMPLVWSINRQLPPEEKLHDRVYGPTLMLRCLESSTEDHEKHFLLGGTPDLLATLQTKLRIRCPAAKIAGVYAPPFGVWPEDENDRIYEAIAESGACYVWVGLGCPKQEDWISANLGHLPAAVYLGVGAAFAFHAGRVKQAPRWMQDRGLEWLHRLLSEPRRLMKRYFIYNSLFIYYSLRERVLG